MAKLGLIIIAFTKCLLAHEGHGVPGALPPAPHGGIVKEAEHTGKDEYAGGNEEVELFFEAVYKDKMFKLYPLTFSPRSTATFVKIPIKQMENISLKIELPRLKKTEILKPTISDESIEASFDSKGVTRFIVHIGTIFKKEAKTAKLQVEVN